MTNARIDANDNPTWLAYNETTGNVEPVCCDPITGALYVYSVADNGHTRTTLENAKIDANDKATQIAYNEDTGKVESLRCSNAGALIINPQ